VGRTGVFIALDYLFSKALEMSAQEVASDPVFETVDELRSYRTLMVCREPQLEYIYTLFREMILAEQSLTTKENGN
jgi:protein tyrosine phosphatase